MISFPRNLSKRFDKSRHPCRTPVSYAAVEVDGTSGLVIEGFDDSDKVGADVVVLHGSPQSCMLNLSLIHI